MIFVPDIIKYMFMFPYLSKRLENYIVAASCALVVVVCSIFIYVYSTPPSYPKELLAADSICEDRPQIADSILRKYRLACGDNMDDDTRWYFRFLALKADVKQGKSLTDDKEASAILGHYLSEQDGRMLPQVYYYVGSAYSSLGNVPQALSCLQDGLALISAREDDDQLKGQYYYMLGYLYTFQYLDSEALGMKLKALSIHRKHNERKRMLYDYISLSWTYKALQKYAEALSSLEKALAIAEKCSPEDLSEIYSQLAHVSLEAGRLKDAVGYAELMLKDVKPANASSVYTISALVYDAAGYKDKARMYYGRILKDGTIYSRQTAARFFADDFRKKGDMARAYDYSMLYANTTDTIMQQNASDYSARANAAYNFKSVENENVKLLSNLSHSRIMLIVFSLLLVLAVVYYWAYRRRTVKEIRRMAALYASIESRSAESEERNKEELQRVKEELDDVDSENDSLRRHLTLKELQLEKLLSKNAILNKVSVSSDSIWKETPLCRELNRIYDNKEPIGSSTIDWRLLEETLFSIYPTFKDGMAQFNKMRDQQYRVCLLIKAGFNVQQIAYLTVRSDEAINSTRRRLYEQNFGRRGKPSDWDKVIRAL